MGEGEEKRKRKEIRRENTRYKRVRGEERCGEKEGRGEKRRGGEKEDRRSEDELQ